MSIIFWVLTLFAVLVVTLVIDWLQTRKIIKHPERWEELNPIIEHFFKKNPWIYFLGWALFFAGVSFWLRSSMWGVLILAFALCNQVHCIWRNWTQGIRL